MATLTVYPDANPETNTVDGNAYAVLTTNYTFPVLSSTSGFAAYDAFQEDYFLFLEAWASTNQWRVNLRGVMLFDTSSLGPNAVIDSATLKLYATFIDDEVGTSIELISANPASNTGLTTSDYSPTRYGTTSFSSLALSSISTGAYFSLPLNSAGLAHIEKESITKFGFRNSQDLAYSASGTSPTWPGAYKQSYVGGYMADSPTNRPYLEIEYHIVATPEVEGSIEITGGVTSAKTTHHTSISGSLLIDGSITSEKIVNNPPGRSYIYRVYDKDWNYLGTWNDVSSELNFSQRINTAGTTIDVELARSANRKQEVRDTLITDASEDVVTDVLENISITAQQADTVGVGTNVDTNLNVEIYVVFGTFEGLENEAGEAIVDENGDQYIVSIGAPLGRRVFSGYVYEWDARYGEDNSINVRLMSHAAELSQAVVTNGSNTTVTYTSQDHGAILKDLITDYAGKISWTSDSIDTTGVSISQTFRLATIYEAIKAVFNQSPSGWYFYVHVGDNLLHFHEKSTTADHTFTLGKDIKSLKLRKSLEGLVNTYYFIGGETAGVPLYKKYTDATSITDHRAGLERVTERTVTDAGTASLYSAKTFDLYSEPLYTTQVDIASEAYLIEDISLGQMVTFAGFDNFIDGLLFQVVGFTYRPTHITLELGAVLETQYEIIARLGGTLQNEAQSNLPTAPS
jgi:hypothetical protein